MRRSDPLTLTITVLSTVAVTSGLAIGLSERHRLVPCSDLYRIIGSDANQSADIADPVEPIERSSSLRGNLVTERFI